MKRAIGAILFVVYSIIAITVTVLLLSYNDYNISEVGGYTVYVVKDDALEPEYEQGSILLIKSTSDKHVKVGDEAFFYRAINSKDYDLKLVANVDLNNPLYIGDVIKDQTNILVLIGPESGIDDNELKQLKENGKYEEMEQQTRRWDEASMTTIYMRGKVDAIDYKYFVEPNIPKFKLSKEWIEEIKNSIKALNDESKKSPLVRKLTPAQPKK